MGLNHPNRNKLSPEKWPDYLRRFRQKHDLSQALLGDYLMIPKRTVEAWEQSESTPPPYLRYALFEIERKIIAKAEHDKQITALTAPPPS